MRTGEQSTRRPDAGILAIGQEAKPSLRRLARLSSNNLLIFCKFRPLNCKGDEQNWHEFNVRCMVDVKSPSRVGVHCISCHEMNYSHPYTQHQCHRTGA